MALKLAATQRFANGHTIAYFADDASDEPVVLGEMQPEAQIAFIDAAVKSGKAADAGIIADVVIGLQAQYRYLSQVIAEKEDQHAKLDAALAGKQASVKALDAVIAAKEFGET